MAQPGTNSGSHSGGSLAVYKFSDSGKWARLSLSHPAPAWHLLSICYPVQCDSLQRGQASVCDPPIKGWITAGRGACGFGIPLSSPLTRRLVRCHGTPVPSQAHRRIMILPHGCQHTHTTPTHHTHTHNPPYTPHAPHIHTHTHHAHIYSHTINSRICSSKVSDVEWGGGTVHSTLLTLKT